MQKKRRFGIREEILISFAIFCVISLGSIAITAGIFNYIIGSSVVGGMAEVSSNLEIQMVILFITLWELIVISLFVGLKVSDSVIKPIHKLTNLAAKLATHDLKTVSFEEIDTDFDKEIEIQDTELGNLTQAFKRLVKKVKTDAEEDKKKS